MKRVFEVCVLAFLLVASASMNGTAFHSGNCPKAGLPELASPGMVDTVSPGQTDTFRLTVPAGGRMYLNVQPLNGDLDIQACSSGSAHVCDGHNPVNMSDGCHIPELGVPCPVCGGGSTSYGPPLGPGTYRLDIKYCFDDPCGYPIPPEATVMPIAYLVTFTDALT